MLEANQLQVWHLQWPGWFFLHKNVLLNYLEIWISGRGNTDGSWQQAICEETAI